MMEILESSWLLYKRVSERRFSRRHKSELLLDHQSNLSPIVGELAAAGYPRTKLCSEDRNDYLSFLLNLIKVAMLRVEQSQLSWAERKTA